MDDTTMIWSRLRERRASLATRSLLDESSPRQKTFAVAMTRFEDQMAAADAAGPATRPLHLYDGLTQAGRAIAAAHAAGQWDISSDGLKVTDTAPEIGDIQVRPDGSGAFQGVAAATGSPAIGSSVSLGALWASHPALAYAAALPGTEYPVALDLSIGTAPGRAPRATIYLPDGLLPETGYSASGWRERFGEVLAQYPGAVGQARIPAEAAAVQVLENKARRWSVLLEWPSPAPEQDWTAEKEQEFFDGIAPEYCYHGERFLRPSVEGAGTQPPSPLMSWWLLLFSFSILARYQPRTWADLLDADQPRFAAGLPFALQSALGEVPHLVLEALDQRPLLLSPALRS